MGMEKKYFVNVVWREGKYFVAQCLNLDVSSFGKTYEEALKNLNEAVELRLEGISEDDVRIVEMPSLSVTPRGCLHA